MRAAVAAGPVYFEDPPATKRGGFDKSRNSSDAHPEFKRSPRAIPELYSASVNLVTAEHSSAALSKGRWRRCSYLVL